MDASDSHLGKLNDLPVLQASGASWDVILSASVDSDVREGRLHFKISLAVIIVLVSGENHAWIDIDTHTLKECLHLGWLSDIDHDTWLIMQISRNVVTKVI